MSSPDRMLRRQKLRRQLPLPSHQSAIPSRKSLPKQSPSNPIRSHNSHRIIDISYGVVGLDGVDGVDGDPSGPSTGIQLSTFKRSGSSLGSLLPSENTSRRPTGNEIS